MSLFGLGRAGSPTPTETPEELGEIQEDLTEVHEVPVQGPDVAELIDSSMRQVADRMQAMSTSLDTFNQDRKSVETRLSAMDERMRKLSMLTEMISSRYNPFITPESANPVPVVAQAAPREAPEPVNGGSPHPALTNGHSAPEPQRNSFPPVEENPLPAPARPRIALTNPQKPPAREALPLPPPPSWTREPDGVASVADLQRHLAQLALGEHLLRVTTRGGALDLLAYYERLAWLGPKTRKELLVSMEGLPAPLEDGPKGERPRRFPAEFHARSLALILRIRGLQIPPDDVLVQWRDLARIAEG